MNIEKRSEKELWIRLDSYNMHFKDKAQNIRTSRDFIDNYCSEEGITPSEWRYKKFDTSSNCDIYRKRLTPYEIVKLGTKPKFFR